ncbi:MAG: translocation/assembly module TamB domain-containing protein [Marinifilaceae bacterium]
MRRFFRILFTCIIALVGVVMLVVLLLYMPPVQRFAINRVEKMMAGKGMELQVDNFRLHFPLTLHTDNVFLKMTDNDMLVSLKRLDLVIPLKPIFERRVEITSLYVEGTHVNFKNDSVMDMRINAGELFLNKAVWHPGSKRVDVGEIQLDGGGMTLLINNANSGQDTTTKANAFDWAFNIEKLSVNEFAYDMDLNKQMALTVGVKTLQVEHGMVDIGGQLVEMDSIYLLDGGCGIDMLSTETNEPGTTPGTSGTQNDTVQGQWMVKLNHINMVNGYFNMEMPGESNSLLDFYDINLKADSVWDRGIEIAARIMMLELKQRHGVEVTSMRGAIDFRENKISVNDMHIATLYSLLDIDVYAPSSISGIYKNGMVTADIVGYVGVKDLSPFVNGISDAFIDKSISIDAHMGIDKSVVEVKELSLEMPGNFYLDVKGKMQNYTELPKMNGKLEIDGKLYSNDILNKLLNNKVILPEKMDMKATLTANKGVAGLNCDVTGTGGALELNGMFNLSELSYNVALRTDGLNVGALIGNEQIGALTGVLHVSGKNFKFPGFEGIVDCRIKALEYNNYDYGDVTVEANCKGNHITATVHSDSKALKLLLRSDATIISDSIRMGSTLTVNYLNPYEMNLSDVNSSWTGDISVKGMWSKNVQQLTLALDSLSVTPYEQEKQAFLPIYLDGESSPAGTSIIGKTGDMLLRIASLESMRTVIGELQKSIALAKEQFKADSLDVDPVLNAMPELQVDIQAGPRNGVNGLLSTLGMGFTKFNMQFSSGGEHMDLVANINSLVLRSVNLDTLTATIHRAADNLQYDVSVAKRKAGVKKFYRIKVAGAIEGQTVTANLKQWITGGTVDYNIGLKLNLLTTSMTISLDTNGLILAKQPWKVNANNYFTLGKNKVMLADLRMSCGSKLLYMYSQHNDVEDNDALHIDVKNLYLQNITAPFPFLPQIGGILNSNIIVYNSIKHTGVSGDVVLDSLSYNNYLVGDLKLGMSYQVESAGVRSVNFAVNLDSLVQPIVSGVLMTNDASSNVDLKVDVNALPLRVINAFVEPDLMKLQGALNGNIHLTNTFQAPRINGELRIDAGKVLVSMVGTTFTISNDVIPIKNSEISFNDFRLLAPNKSFMALNGWFNMRNLNRVTASLDVNAKNFELVNVAKSDSVMIYGKAYSNISATLRGDVRSLKMMGDVAILSGSSLNYRVSKSAQQQVVNKASGLVQFVEFADTLQNIYLSNTLQYTGSNFNLKLFVGIAPNVQFSVELPGGSDNQVLIVGGGNLIFSITPAEGITLYGKYTVTSGNVRYSIPVVGTKAFKIQSGSFVEWLGSAMNPRLNITATEAVKANVQQDGQASRLVMFDAIIKITSSLQNPAITFDISAPDDMDLQNQIATFSAEERSKQAMNLLVYGSYSGPGAVKTGQAGANSLYNFVEGELNQWSRKLFKHADLTFGVDSYDQYSASGQGSTRTDYSYQFSKQFFNDRVMVKVGGKISTDSDPSTNSVEENLIDDVDVEYRMKRNPNFYLKVFRHTNFLSVLEGDITETGAGIVWRKQFRSWRTLFIRTVKKANEDK